MAAEDADQFIYQGDNFQWKNGYDTLISHLKEKLPESIVRLSSPVNQVAWSSATHPSRALVVTQGDEAFLARHVLVTVSAAYLQKHHATLFQPGLPDDFVQSLEGVRLGVANKVQIGWPDPWWGSQPLLIDILWTHFNLPHHMSWMYGSVTVFSVHRQRAVLELFVTGENSTYMEELQEYEVKDHVVHLLREASGQDVPQPTFFRRTRWSRDPWTLGSYSTFVTMEGMKAGLHTRSQLATPLNNSAGHTTLEKIEESRAARLAGNQDQHRALSRRTRTLLGRDKERYVRSLAEDVEGQLNANDLRLAYRALKKLRSKTPFRASAIRAADGRLVSDMDGQMARWAEYFGQLFTVLLWAGEHTHNTRYSTVDGAMDTGHREARRIVGLLESSP
ncbi:Peroxisomal N(1)-acetyl-spermine/spermidine oxidase [Chionoecetes opilio]|uniref:Peroxisomal N(1)-acetyl-spermine/spermidine oxidase n=1 Tax=Chionoecetes opilio TaxID=41210 RepID=A0A8J5CL78_CHIOP|nr:Peroxisomal N(1)-acetyl-spermine/spermidine oxidase [Chionoecetes opilio]